MMGEPVPENLVDMITYELIEEPVVAEDGYTYSKAAIIDWFEGCQITGEPITSPITRIEMGNCLRPDPVKARAIDQFKINCKSQGKSYKYNDSTQTIGTLAKIFEIIDPLRDLFATKNWQAPALVVMGNENSGKSSLLERLAMMPIFPKDKFICTRMAIRVHLRRGPSMAPRLDVFDKQAGVVLWSRVLPMERGREFVREAMETVMMQEFGGLTGVSKSKMLILHITGPRCPNLDMVDLPGLVSTHVRGEPENMRNLTSDLVESYVRENSAHSLFLVTVPATAAPNQSLAFEIVQKMGLHDRSIGVFTKSDKCDLRDESDGMGGLRDLRAKVRQQSRDTVPLDNWGYVCVMNKPVTGDASEGWEGEREGNSERERESNYSALLRQSQEEVMFFRERGMSDLLESQTASCSALLARVSVMFHDYLRTSWAPSTILLLKEELQAVREEDRALGLPRADKFTPEGLAPSSSSFKASSASPTNEDEDRICGNDDEEDFFSSFNLNTTAAGESDARASREDMLGCVTRGRLIAMLAERATELLAESSGRLMQALERDILPNLYHAIHDESCELSGKPSEIVAHQFGMKERMSMAVKDALNQVTALVSARVSGSLNSDKSSLKLSRFPAFIQTVTEHVLHGMKPWKAKAEEVMITYVNTALQSPLSNPSFHLKYTFQQVDQTDRVQASVWMCFDAESLASTLAHTLLLRASLLLTDSLALLCAETLSKLPELNPVPGACDPLVESGSARRTFLRNIIGKVRGVVSSLMRHLSLTPQDMLSFSSTGLVQPLRRLRTCQAPVKVVGSYPLTELGTFEDEDRLLAERALAQQHLRKDPTASRGKLSAAPVTTWKPSLDDSADSSRGNGGSRSGTAPVCTERPRLDRRGFSQLPASKTGDILPKYKYSYQRNASDAAHMTHRHNVSSDIRSAGCDANGQQENIPPRQNQTMENPANKSPVQKTVCRFDQNQADKMGKPPTQSQLEGSGVAINQQNLRTPYHSGDSNNKTPISFHSPPNKESQDTNCSVDQERSPRGPQMLSPHLQHHDPYAYVFTKGDPGLMQQQAVEPTLSARLLTKFELYEAATSSESVEDELLNE